MWHSVCDGMSTCCNNGGSCCAGKPSEKKGGREKHVVVLRPPTPSPVCPDKEESDTHRSNCEWPFECEYSCAEPEPEPTEPEGDPTHGWGKLIEKDPPELEPYNPPVPCGIGYPCGYRSRGKMYMPGGPGQVFPRMPCHPVCHPCGPCNPCGPCSPSPCRPCNPCNPCVPCVPCMPCDGARGRCISLVAPGVPTSGLYKKKKGKKKRKGKKKKKGKKGDSKLGAGDGDGRRRRRGECVEECPGPGGKRGSKARGSELRSRDSDASYRDGDGRGRDGDGRGRDGDGRGRDGDGRGRDGDGRGGDGRGRDGDGRGRDGDGRGRDGDGRGRDGDGRGRSGRGSGFGRDGRGRDGRGGDGYGDGYGDGRGRDGRGRDGRGKDGRDVYSREGQGRDGRNGNGRFGSRTSFGRGGGGGGNGKDGGGIGGGGGGGPGGRDGKCVCPSRVFRRPTSPPCVCEAGGDGHREAAGGGPCARGRTASSAGGPGRGRPRARGRSHSEDPRRSSCTLCPFARKQVSKAVSAIVALSLLAANHASGACTCPESGPAGLAPGAAPCPGAASAPACPAMAPGCPPAAPGCPAAGPAVHVPCAPPGFSDESACPADQAQAPAGCLRPTLSEMPKPGAMDCPMIAKAPLALEKHGVQFLGTGQPTFCHTGGYSPPNPPIKHGPCLGEHGSAQQAENGPPQQQGNVCLLGLRPEMYPELPSIYSQWLGCGPYFPNPVPGMPGLPACIPGMGSPRGILPPCVAQEPEPSQSPPQSPPSSPAPAASPPSSPGCTASPDRNKRAEMNDQAASAATMNGGGNGNGSNVEDAAGPQAAGAAAPVADCGCGRRRGPCPPHCMQPKPGDDGEARRHERMRRRLESRVPKCTLPLVLPYQRRRASSKSVAKPLPEPPKAPDSPKPKTEPCVEEKAPEPKPPDSPERTETPDEWGIPSLTPFHVPPRRTRSVSTPPGFRPEAPANGPVVCPLMGPTCPMITGPTGAMMPLAATGPVPAGAVGVAVPVRPIMAAGPPGPAGPALQAAPGAAPGQVAAAPAPRPKGAPSYGTGPCEDRPRRGQSETRRQGRSRRRRNYTNFDPVTGKCLPCPVQPAGCARTGQPEPGMGPLLGPCDPPPERALKCGRVPTLDGRAAPCTMTLQPDEKPPCLQSKTLICKRTPITNTLICYERGPPLPCVADPNLCGKPGTCVEMPCMQPVPRPPPPPPPPFTRKQLWPPCPNARSAPQPASICDAPPRRSKSRRPKDGPKAKADDCPTFTRCVTGHP